MPPISSIVVRTALAIGFVAAWPLAAQEAQKPQVGLSAGQEVPFFVVDFCHGENVKHAGCPGVIVSNHETRGILLIAREAGSEVLKLAQSLQGQVVDGKRVLGFVIVKGAGRKELAAACEKSELKSWEAGVPRDQSWQRLTRSGLADDTALAVVFLDQKTVKASYLLKSGDLTEEKRTEIMAAAKKFAEKKE